MPGGNSMGMTPSPVAVVRNRCVCQSGKVAPNRVPFTSARCGGLERERVEADRPGGGAVGLPQLVEVSVVVEPHEIDDAVALGGLVERDDVRVEGRELDGAGGRAIADQHTLVVAAFGKDEHLVAE